MQQNKNQKGVYSFLVNRPKGTFLILVCAAILSCIAMLQLKKQLIPSYFSSNNFHIRFSEILGSPSSIDENFAHPLAKELQQLKGVEKVQTFSSQNRLSVSVRFPPETNLRNARSMLTNAINKSASFMPESMQYRIRRWDPDQSPILWVGIQVDTKEREEKFQKQQYFEEQLLPSLQGVEGVAEVNTYGKNKVAIQVRLLPGVLKQYKINASDVAKVLRKQYNMEALGIVSGTNIHYSTELKNLEEVENLYLTSALQLKNVANVEKIVVPRYRYVSLDGKSLFFMSFKKTSDANLTELAKSIDKKLIQISEKHNYRFETLWSQAKTIKSLLDDVSMTIIYAIVASFLSVILFIRSIKMALLLLCGIPLTLLFTLATLKVTGQTINLVTLSGLLVAAGLMVDNSIVVLEQLKREGYWSVKRLVGPLLASSLTSICIFFPAFLFEQNSGFARYLRHISAPIMATIMFSLFVSLVILPFIFHWLKQPQKTETPSKKDRLSVKPYFFGLFFNRHIYYMLACLLFLGASFFLSTLLPKKAAEIWGNKFRFEARFDRQIGFSTKTQYVQWIENILLKNKLKIGFKSLRVDLRGRNTTNASYRLEMLASAPRSLRAIESKVTQIVPRIVGVSYSLDDSETDSFGEQESPLNWTLLGNDYLSLKKNYLMLKEKLIALQNVTSVTTDADTSPLKVFSFELTSKTSEARGIAETLSTSTETSEVSELEDGTSVFLSYLSPLENIALVQKTIFGGIPLETFSTGAFEKIPETIRRRNGYVSLGFEVNINPKLEKVDYQNASTNIQNYVENFLFSSGVKIENQALRAASEKSRGTMVIALLALLLLLVILGSYLESLYLGFGILMSVVFAGVGAQITGQLLGVGFGFGKVMAIILLAGISVNIGIVLIAEFEKIYNQTAKSLDCLQRSIEQGVAIRLKPILMTVVTTITGMIPMAIADDPIPGLPFSDLAKLVIGGMLYSLPICLIWVPALYYSKRVPLQTSITSLVPKRFHKNV